MEPHEHVGLLPSQCYLVWAPEARLPIRPMLLCPPSLRHVLVTTATTAEITTHAAAAAGAALNPFVLVLTSTPTAPATATPNPVATAVLVTTASVATVRVTAIVDN